MAPSTYITRPVSHGGRTTSTNDSANTEQKRLVLENEAITKGPKQL